MGQLTRLFVISRIFFMGFLISGAAIAETSPIEPVSAVISSNGRSTGRHTSLKRFRPRLSH